MTPAEQKAINDVMVRLNEHSMEVFNIATQAIMQADPNAERFDRGSIREGLEAAIEIMDIYDKHRTSN